MTGQQEEARALWSLAEEARTQARLLRIEADCLIATSKRFEALAAALSEGREQEIRDRLLDLSGQWESGA